MSIKAWLMDRFRGKPGFIGRWVLRQDVKWLVREWIAMRDGYPPLPHMLPPPPPAPPERKK
jgi:hypothetical protein